MIGRKIVDNIEDCLLHARTTTAASEFRTRPSDLPIRGLRINTTYASAWAETSRTLQDCTNVSSVEGERRNSCLSEMTSCSTPDTSYTFGRPNPASANGLTSPTSSVSGSSLASERMLQRYSRAEQELAQSLKRCPPERSPQELQIRALEKATALLTAHAQDARNRAAQLRACLVNRGIDREMYNALQKERWLEERKQVAMDQEMKELVQQLASLKGEGAHSGGEDSGASAGEAEGDGIDAGNGPGGVIDREARRRAANLVRFFEISPTRMSFSASNKASPISFAESSTSRPMATGNVSAVPLRPLSLLSPVATNLRTHTRSLSLDTTFATTSPKKSSKRRTFESSEGGLALPMVAEDGHIITTPRQRYRPHARGSTLTTSVDTYRLSTAQDMMATSSNHSQSSTSSLHVKGGPQPSSSVSSSAVSDGLGGVATILPSLPPRTAAELLAGLDENEVAIPSYVNGLIGELDLIHHDITLPPLKELPPVRTSLESSDCASEIVDVEQSQSHLLPNIVWTPSLYEGDFHHHSFSALASPATSSLVFNDPPIAAPLPPIPPRSPLRLSASISRDVSHSSYSDNSSDPKPIDVPPPRHSALHFLKRRDRTKSQSSMGSLPENFNDRRSKRRFGFLSKK